MNETNIDSQNASLKRYKNYTLFTTLQCKHCKRAFLIPIYLAENRKFCSLQCSSRYHSEHVNPTIEKERRLKLSTSHKGQHNSPKTEFKKGCHPSVETEIKKGQHLSKRTEFGNAPPWNKGKPYLQIQGAKHANWKGGRSLTRGSGWVSKREQVWLRDNYTCRVCGSKPKILHTHHIIPYRITHDNSLGNLITVCRSCHTKLDARFSAPCPIITNIMLHGEP